jgi:hypothetical protein
MISDPGRPTPAADAAEAGRMNAAVMGAGFGDAGRENDGCAPTTASAE